VIDPLEGEKFLRRSLNFFYRCAAVETVQIGKRGPAFYHWEITLYAGNDPRWLKPYRKDLIRRIRERRQEIGRQGPDGITVSAPDMPVVKYAVNP